MNGDGGRAQMKVEMTLDAPPEAGAVADGGIIPKCVRELLQTSRSTLCPTSSCEHGCIGI